MTMKPIRSNELEFWNNLVSDEFRSKQEDIQTELSQKAQEVSDSTNDAFIKKCGVDSDLKDAEKKYAKYLDFKITKKEKENALYREYADAREIILEKLQRLSKSRNWNNSFSDNDVDPDDIKRKLRDCNYDEAYKVAEQKHAVYNQLKKIKKNCKVAIHTGADIKDVVATLSNEMKKAQISLDVPSSLLGLPSPK
jgi:hypothetical protein